MFSKTLALVALIAILATVAEAKFKKNLRFADKRRALFPKRRSRRLTKVGKPPNNCWCGGARNSRGYTCPCFDVMEDNVGGGRVYGEYNKGPYRAGAEYNWDEENDDERVGRGDWRVGVEYSVRWDQMQDDEA